LDNGCLSLLLRVGDGGRDDEGDVDDDDAAKAEQRTI
jgi:hypothetical protein